MFGTEEQKRRYLPGMASGEVIACFGLTEPNTGSDAKAIRLKATWNDDRKGWIVNGAKRFITSANAAGGIVLPPRTRRPGGRARRTPPPPPPTPHPPTPLPAPA